MCLFRALSVSKAELESGLDCSKIQSSPAVGMFLSVLKLGQGASGGIRRQQTMSRSANPHYEEPGD